MTLQRSYIYDDEDIDIILDRLEKAGFSISKNGVEVNRKTLRRVAAYPTNRSKSDDHLRD